MDIVIYSFVALLCILVNEYRLIKKYIRAHNNNIEKTNLEKVISVIAKPFLICRNWINHAVLNDELYF